MQITSVILIYTQQTFSGIQCILRETLLTLALAYHIEYVQFESKNTPHRTYLIVDIVRYVWAY